MSSLETAVSDLTLTLFELSLYGFSASVMQEKRWPPTQQAGRAAEGLEEPAPLLLWSRPG